MLARGINLLLLVARGINLLLLVARGMLICQSQLDSNTAIGCAYCPTALTSTARAIGSIAVALPLLAAGFSALCRIPLETREIKSWFVPFNGSMCSFVGLRRVACGSAQGVRHRGWPQIRQKHSAVGSLDCRDGDNDARLAYLILTTILLAPCRLRLINRTSSLAPCRLRLINRTSSLAPAANRRNPKRAVQIGQQHFCPICGHPLRRSRTNAYFCQ